MLKPIAVDTVDDFIAIRFLLSMSQTRFAESLGLDKSQIQFLESGRAKMQVKYLLAAKALLLLSPNAEARIATYNAVNRHAYVAFLRQQTSSGRLPQITDYSCKACGCISGEMSHHIKEFYDTSQMSTFTVTCNVCSFQQPVFAIAQIREFRLAVEGTLDVYQPENYSYDRWRKQDARVLLSVRYDATHRLDNPFVDMEVVDTPNKLIAMRFMMALSHRQLSSLLDIHPASICSWEQGRHPIPYTMQVAFTALLEEWTLLYPWYAKQRKKIKPDKLVNFLLKVSDRKGALPRTSKPVCPECGSWEITSFKEGDIYGFTCEVCERSVKKSESKSLKRWHHLNNQPSFTFMSARWY